MTKMWSTIRRERWLIQATGGATNLGNQSDLSRPVQSLSCITGFLILPTAKIVLEVWMFPRLCFIITVELQKAGTGIWLDKSLYFLNCSPLAIVCILHCPIVADALLFSLLVIARDCICPDFPPTGLIYGTSSFRTIHTNYDSYDS